MTSTYDPLRQSEARRDGLQRPTTGLVNDRLTKPLGETYPTYVQHQRARCLPEVLLSTFLLAAFSGLESPDLASITMFAGCTGNFDLVTTCQFRAPPPSPARK